VDYLSLSLRDGRIAISINLGNGPLDAAIHPDHLRFDDHQWHSVRVHRKVQEVSLADEGLLLVFPITPHISIYNVCG